MKLVYDVSDRPAFKKVLLFAFQQMIAIMAATLLVPMLVTSFGLEADPSAALFGAGIGTLVYIFFTQKKSPVFLGSSFTFLGAYSASIGQNFGYLGIILGVLFAGLVYVIIGLIIKYVGPKWVNMLMPSVIIGPIVAIIGLSLSGTATSWMATNGGDDYSLLTILIGAITFFAIVIASVKGSENIRLVPFIVGIAIGYFIALGLTLVGGAADIDSLQVMSFDSFETAFKPLTFSSFIRIPDFFFVKAIQEKGWMTLSLADIGSIAIIYVPIGVVELAQHIADHKNLGNIINKDLIIDPGLDKTLMGDGVGSIVGSLFGGAANTTYGESIGCVAITGNASIVTIAVASLGSMILSFFTPFVAIINSIPKCVMGGACVALYGFIAVSGLQMLRRVDLNNNKNLFIVSGILVTGIGGLTLEFGTNKLTGGPILTITSLAVALLFGFITNLIVNNGRFEEEYSEKDLKKAQPEALAAKGVTPVAPRKDRKKKGKK
ncbi:MAG: uracil-xanthine permease [Clostridiales bacterium]|nr:uracil-xanthine permease [Clostridiales bacterium]